MSLQYSTHPQSALQCPESSQFDPTTKRTALAKTWRYVILLASRTMMVPKVGRKELFGYFGAIIKDKNSGGKTQPKTVGGTISGWKAAERKHPAYGCQMQSQLSVSSCWEVEVLGSAPARHQLVNITDPQTTSIFNPRHSLNSRSLNREQFYV